MKDFMETVRGGKKAIRNEERKKKRTKHHTQHFCPRICEGDVVTHSARLELNS